MHRELQTVIDQFLEKMREKGWSYAQLSAATEPRVPKGTIYQYLRRRDVKRPRPLVISSIGEALGVAPEVVRKAVDLAEHLKSREKKEEPVSKAVERPGFESIEARLQKASNYFRLGVKELEGIDEDVARILSDISERLRATSVLKNHLSIFADKH